MSGGPEPGDSPLDPELRERLRVAPKVELHLHLDGVSPASARVGRA